MTAVGVRADESRGRGGREAFTSFGGVGNVRGGGISAFHTRKKSINRHFQTT